MKIIKNIIIICVLVLSVALLAGCNGPEPEPEPTKTIEEVKADVIGAFNKYGVADNGAFKLVVKSNNAESTVDMVYNYEGGKIGINSLKAELTNANGTMGVYVTDGKAYTNRYGASKTVIDLDESEAEKIANEYSFNQFNEYLILLLNNSFFASSTVTSEADGVVKVVLNIGTYNIDNEPENEVLTTIYDGIQEASSVTLEVSYSDAGLTGVKVAIEKDVVSTIELQLLGTGTSEIAIQFPDFSDYTK